MPISKMNSVRFPLILLSLAVLAGCQSVKKAPGRETRPTTPPASTGAPPPVSAPTADVDEPAPPTSEEPLAPEPVTPPRPETRAAKIGLILGPGGMRAWAHAGVLQEIHRSQLPIQFIAGLEMGALPAALYSAKPQAFEPEWQMSKLKDEDFVRRTLIGGSQAVDLKDWRPYFQAQFGATRIDDARIPFACLTYQNEKQQILILNKGGYAQAMPFCLSYPPIFRGYEGHMAAASQLTVLAKYMRQKGATHLIYVDVLGDRGRLLPARGDENVQLIWNLTQAHLTSQSALVDDVLRIPLSDEITSFSRRRDMIKQGKEAAAKGLKPILKKYGLD